MSSIRLISAAFLLAAAAAPTACTIEKAPAQPPPAAPAPAAPAAAAPAPIAPLCPPVGMWKVGGPAGTQSIKVTESNNPGSYTVWYNGTQASAPGQVQQNHFTFDTGAASGGLASCDLAKDCKTMSCGFKGGQPIVFNKAE
jgi:hypothetical protein